MSNEKLPIYLGKEELKEIFLALGLREQFLINLNFVPSVGVLARFNQVRDLRDRISSEINSFDWSNEIEDLPDEPA